MVNPERSKWKIFVVFSGVVVLAICCWWIGAVFAYSGGLSRYKVLSKPMRVLRSYLGSRVGSATTTRSWQVRPPEQEGVVRRNPDRTWGQYTFLCPLGSTAYLVDLEGQIRYKWHLPFEEVWPDASHVKRPVPPSKIKMMGCRLFPDGSVLAHYKAKNDTPYGYGLVKMNKQAEPVWKFSRNVHHDISVTDGGDKIYTLTHEVTTTPEALTDIPELGPFILEDRIVALTGTGTVKWQMSIVDAIMNSPYRRIIRNWRHRYKPWDLLHANAVREVSEDFSEHHSFVEPGDLIVSLRTLNAFIAIDPSRRRVTWATRGFWVKQHDPDLLPNGNILFFDNRGKMGTGGMSRVVEFNPGTGQMTWSFSGNEDLFFESRTAGGQQRLPNGNVLINETRRGRILEVTPEKRIAWAYNSPFRTVEDGEIDIEGIGFGVDRFRAEALEFVGK